MCTFATMPPNSSGFITGCCALRSNASTASGLSDGSLAFAPQLCDLGAECRMLLENIQSIADDNGIVLDVHIPEAPIECALDTALIQRMLLNIIANCMERCSRGDRIHIAVTQEGDRADIIICDDGHTHRLRRSSGQSSSRCA